MKIKYRLYSTSPLKLNNTDSELPWWRFVLNVLIKFSHISVNVATQLVQM